MQPRLMFSFFPVVLAMLVFAGVSSASAEDVHIGVGVGVGGGGDHHWNGNHVYNTHDTTYGTWYPNDGTTYVYSDAPTVGYYNNAYSTPYVYATPSVEFGTWYGGGYHNHGGSYGGSHGGYSGGSHSGGGHSGGHH